MKYLLQRSGQPIKGNIFLPASKSISNRLLIIQALSGGFEIENLSESNDTKVLQEALNSHCVL
ncbi:MAG: 3-phosphoshikimate 1-carboxyvinyltransferase, partial [Bacteroidota bacterium]|nr:3-phosphoshikimate 1-carboxyvinyltransferase [Bacteroidota bacterium]